MGPQDMAALGQGPAFNAPALQEQQPPPEPLPADRLYRMYQAWEQAKIAEITEGYLARRYYHGKQWSDGELGVLKKRRQPPVTSNRINRKVDFLVGVEQRLRRDAKAHPRGPEDEHGAWIATAALRFVQDQNHWPAVASDAMHDALVTGIGCVHQCIEVKRGRPEITKRHIQADRFFYDPRSERWDFSDARYLGTHQWLDIDEAIELIPQGAEMIDAIAGASFGGAAGSSGTLPQDWQKEKNWVDTERRRIYIIEIHYKNKGEWMYDYLCGSLSLLPEKQIDRVSPYLDEDEKTMHPYLPWSPYVDERGDRYGVVRNMFSPQDEINKRRSKLLHMLSVRQTKGEKGVVADVDTMKRELAKADGHVETNPGKNFEIIDQSANVSGQAELLAEAKGEIENLGPNPGLIGRGVEKQSGRAILAQQNSGMTELSPVFERGREWKLKSFRKDWALIKQFWTGERAIRITGQADAPQFLNLNQITQHPETGQIGIQNNVTELDVDIIIEEGPDTITMQEELMDQLTALGPGAVPPEVIIQMSNFKDKDKLLKMLADAKAPPPQVIDMQKRMGVLEQMLKATQVDKVQSETEFNRARAYAAMVGIGAQPAQIGQSFPMHYAQPTQQELIAQANGIGQPPQPPQGGPMPFPQGNIGAPPQLGPPPGPPPGPMGAPPLGGMVGAPPPMPTQFPPEPQLNQPGGLPIPPQNGPSPPPPTVPMH